MGMDQQTADWLMYGPPDVMGPPVIGPQTDGTNNPAPASVAVTPVDAGGGPAGQYAPAVLDFFKYGIGVWNSQVQQQNLLDYKRYEATALGLVPQGQNAAYGAVRVSGGGSPLIWILLIGGAVLLLKD